MLSPCWENQSSARADRLDIPGIPVAAASFPKTDGHWLGKAATSWDKDIWHHGFRGPSKIVYRQSIPMWGRCCTVKSKQQQGELQTPQVGWEGPTPPQDQFTCSNSSRTPVGDRGQIIGGLICVAIGWNGRGRGSAEMLHDSVSKWTGRASVQWCICPVTSLSSSHGTLVPCCPPRTGQSGQSLHVYS